MASTANAKTRRPARAVIVLLCLGGLLNISSRFSCFLGAPQYANTPAPVPTSEGVREDQETVGQKPDQAAYLEDSPVPSSNEESVALVQINEESKLLAASIIPGAIGFILGGSSIWLGVAFFVVGAWAARQENDLGEALGGASEVSMSAVNFGAKVAGKYQIGDKIGNAFSSVLEKSGNEDTAKKISEAVGGFKAAIADVNEDVGITATLGSFFSTGGTLASKAVDKAAKAADDFKLTEKLQQKFDEATEKAKAMQTSKVETEKEAAQEA